jgi:hypothetical protein
MYFPVPFWIFAVVVVLGAVIWLIEQPKKARQRHAARVARATLRDDLQAPPPSGDLPYGFGAEPDDNHQ